MARLSPADVHAVLRAAFIPPDNHRRRSARGHSSSPADQHLNPPSAGRGREIMMFKQTTRQKVDSRFLVSVIGALYTTNHTPSAAITRDFSFLTKADSA